MIVTINVITTINSEKMLYRTGIRYLKKYSYITRQTTTHIQPIS